MKQTSIDALNNHLFEVIEMLKNNSDPTASPNEKIDIETAKTIANVASVVVEGFKTKAQVMAILSKSSNPGVLNEVSKSAGILPESTN